MLNLLFSSEDGRYLLKDEVEPTLREERRSENNKNNYDSSDNIRELSNQARYVSRSNESCEYGGSSKHNCAIKK